jgi:hypothetical protein
MNFYSQIPTVVPFRAGTAAQRRDRPHGPGRRAPAAALQEGGLLRARIRR